MREENTDDELDSRARRLLVKVQESESLVKSRDCRGCTLKDNIKYIIVTTVNGAAGLPPLAKAQHCASITA